MAVQMKKQPLAKFRILAGFNTQGDLAKAAKVSGATVSNAESGAKTISRNSAYRILYALKMAGAKVSDDIDEIEWRIREEEELQNLK